MAGFKVRLSDGSDNLTFVGTTNGLYVVAPGGKLQHFLFDDMEGPSADFMKNLAGAFFNMPVAKRILLNKEVRSRFLDFANKAAGEK